MMRRLAYFGGVFFIAAALAHLVVICQTPIKAMETVENRLRDRLGGANRMSYGAPRTSQHRVVVMPSPDLLYSACPYDLSEGPVEITFEPPTDLYWSISLYAHNTENYHTFNAGNSPGSSFRAVIAGASARLHEEDNSTVVISPTSTGIALLRIFMPDRNGYEEIAAIQKTADCHLLTESTNLAL